jgi:hypothetical protein
MITPSLPIHHLPWLLWAAQHKWDHLFVEVAKVSKAGRNGGNIADVSAINF